MRTFCACVGLSVNSIIIIYNQKEKAWKMQHWWFWLPYIIWGTGGEERKKLQREEMERRAFLFGLFWAGVKIFGENKKRETEYP